MKGTYYIDYQFVYIHKNINNKNWLIENIEVFR
jgi:hypothetical protein